MALFGCAPKRPLDYSGSAGLVWAINGGRLVELHRDWAVIERICNGAGSLRCSRVHALVWLSTANHIRYGECMGVLGLSVTPSWLQHWDRHLVLSI
jgi:hypothetical protein